MSEFSKSIKAILYDRIASPFYGTIIISWLLWNWKIPYVTFFVEQARLKENKIDYIINQCNDIHHLITFPLISTILILTLVPFLTNGAYWITLIFDEWRNTKKNEIEGKRLLTLEQSIMLRTELQDQEESFDKLLKGKNDEIELLRSQLNAALTKDKDSTPKIISVEEQYKDELDDFFNNQKVLKFIDKVAYYAQTGYRLSDVPVDIVSYYVANDLIKSTGTSTYAFTEKGKYFLKEYLKHKEKLT